MEFEKGQKVWAREKTYCPSGWKEFLEKYPDRIFVIDSMSCGQMSPDRYFSFNPSDLSPIYHYKGMRLVEEGGEERKLQKDEYVIWKSGEVSRWIGPEESSSKHKILIPLPLPEKEVKEMECECTQGNNETLEDVKPKYEVIKPFTPHDFLKARLDAHGDCNNREFKSDSNWLVSIAGNDQWRYVDEDKLLAELDKRPCMKDHMLNEYNMIREVKPERFYNYGQKFRHEIGSLHILQSAGLSEIIMAEIDTGRWGGYRIKVSNIRHITPAEFSQICGGKPEEFELVEEEA